MSCSLRKATSAEVSDVSSCFKIRCAADSVCTIVTVSPDGSCIDSLTFTGTKNRIVCMSSTYVASLSALGCAAVNAWFNRRESMETLGVALYPPEIDEGDVFRTLKPECAGKLVSTVGHFRGGEKLAGMRELRVFEKDPRPGDYPEWEEDRLLPGSDVVVITGMALTNGTMPHILELCRDSQIVALSGPSVPVSPIWFDHGVTALFGTLCWNIPGCRKAMRYGGHKDTWKYMGKSVLRK